MSENNNVAPSKGKERLLKIVADYAAECERDIEDVRQRAKDRYLQAVGGQPFTHINGIGRRKNGGVE